MITLQNMIFANPQAYRVFPQIANPYNTGITDTATYTGYIQVTDSNGTTKSFSNTNIIDFSGFTGIIDIDQYTDTGSIKLGRWNTDKLGITHYEMEIIPNTYYFSNQVYYNYPLHATQYEVVTIGDKEVSRKEVDLGMMSRESEDWLECNWGSADNEVLLDVYANPNSSHRKGIVYLSEPKTGIEEIPVYIYQDGTAVWTLDQISHATIIDAIPAEGYDSGVDSTDIHFSIEYTSDTIGGVSIIPVENMEDFSGDYDWFTISNLGDRNMGRAAFYFDLHVQPNTSTESRSVQVPISWEWYRTEDTPDNVFEGMNHVVGTSYLTITQLGIQEPVYESPYTPGWSMEFGYITSGTAAKKITNGIEVYSTGPDTSSDTATFFNYNETIKEGETYYQATIQVTGMKEGYTIVGVRGWESVTITQDGEYVLPAYTWTNEQGLPEGSDIYNDYKPALKFAVGTESNVVWDKPITLVITAVETMEQSVQKAMVLWYDIAKQGATNESMAADPRLIDHSGNGHHATCYNFAWTEDSGISTVNYPNALVSDGVDDYCLVDGLPILTKEKGYTVIAKRKWIITGLGAVCSKMRNDNGAFQLERVNGIVEHPNVSVSYNQYNSVTVNNDDAIVYQTTYDYNGSTSLSTQDVLDTDFMSICSVTRETYSRHSGIVLYSLLLFNRDLSTDEIEWVKTNLITE